MNDDKTIDLKKRNEINFTYHAPGPEDTAKYEAIRATAKGYANQLADLCPMSRELSLALTALEESVMWANASIARNKGF